MTLREARSKFSLCLARLLLKAEELGYEIAIDEVTDRITKKDPTTDHMKGSLHEIGLAADLNLYKNGLYLSKTEDHQGLGEYWEQMGKEKGLPLCWGGRFGDGNHYAFAWEGRK